MFPSNPSPHPLRSISIKLLLLTLSLGNSSRLDDRRAPVATFGYAHSSYFSISHTPPHFIASQLPFSPQVRRLTFPNRTSLGLMWWSVHARLLLSVCLVGEPLSLDWPKSPSPFLRPVAVKTEPASLLSSVSVPEIKYYILSLQFNPFHSSRRVLLHIPNLNLEL